MIIYWDNLEKSANDDQTIPEYIASNYVPSVHFARNIYWEGQKNKSGGVTDIPEYIKSGHQNIYNKRLTEPVIVNLIGNDGWIKETDTWVYVSATTFKIEGKDVRSKFPKGTKLKLTQNTAKYFYVVGSAFSTNTTITVTGGTTYTLANEAITSPYYSYASTPQGFPQVFSWTPVYTGVTVGNATNVGAFCLNGNVCSYSIKLNLGSTSTVDNYIKPHPPITTLSKDDVPFHGNVLAKKDGGAYYTALYWIVQNAGSTGYNIRLDGSVSAFNATIPFTWGEGDFLMISGSYLI